MKNKNASPGPANPAAAYSAPGLVPNNPKNFLSFSSEPPQRVYQNPYDDGVGVLPGVTPMVTPAQQQVMATRGLNGPVGLPRPFDPGMGDLAISSTNLPMGFPDGGPLARMNQRGTNMSPSMSSSGPRRNEPPPKPA